jgi:lipopolysaccharide transport system permease protein
MGRIVVDVSSNKFRLDVRELLRYKDLFYVLAYRDLRVRYAQTLLGLFWAFLQPAATLLIFILIFGKAVKVDTGTVPYALYALTGMTAWSYFSFVLSQSGQSIIGAQEMVKKIYFPRLIIPLSKAMVGFVDFFIALIFLIIMIIIYRFKLSFQLIWFPLFFLINMVTALAAGIWLSALSIRYRDFIHVIPFLVQLGLYVTPVGYPVNLIPQKYQLLYHLNPMAGVVEGFRYSILGTEPLNQYSYISFIVGAVLFITGILYFKKVEKIMADFV